MNYSLLVERYVDTVDCLQGWVQLQKFNSTPTPTQNSSTPTPTPTPPPHQKFNSTPTPTQNSSTPTPTPDLELELKISTPELEFNSTPIQLQLKKVQFQLRF